MFISDPLPFVAEFIDDLNGTIEKHNPGASLTRIQKSWLSFCIMAIYVTRTLCWAKFERASLGKRSMAAISWMFRNSKIPWESQLAMSATVMIRRFGITRGLLVVDETDKKRSKSTKRIHKVHKILDKSSGGYVMGQKLVFLVPVTGKITIPVGFRFFMPDPELREWKKSDEKLRKKGAPKKARPAEPADNPNFPKIPEIALFLMEEFKARHPEIKVDCVLADALYGTRPFLDAASGIFGKVQTISQIKKNQNILHRNKKMWVEKYFASYPGVEKTIRSRGGEKKTVIVGSARLRVCSHKKKRFVIALKHKGEKEYRYIVATDLSWRTLDIVEAYTFRWLIEVFFEDWKIFEGWGSSIKHTGEDGSRRGVILSLMADHCLFFHPDQKDFLED